jgi:hypothetical protein
VKRKLVFPPNFNLALANHGPSPTVLYARIHQNPSTDAYLSSPLNGKACDLSSYLVYPLIGHCNTSSRKDTMTASPRTRQSDSHDKNIDRHTRNDSGTIYLIKSFRPVLIHRGSTCTRAADHRAKPGQFLGPTISFNRTIIKSLVCVPESGINPMNPVSSILSSNESIPSITVGLLWRSHLLVPPIWSQTRQL